MAQNVWERGENVTQMRFKTNLKRNGYVKSVKSERGLFPQIRREAV